MTPSQVIELNNCAVALMKQEHYRDAIVATSFALKHYRELEMAQTLYATTNSCNDSDSIDQCMMQTDASESQNGSTAGEYIYEHGILIPSDAHETVNIAAILIFNSALSHQLLARKHPGAVPQNILLKAQRLYELAYDLQDSEENVLFKFAVINNTAIIHKAVGNQAMLEECLDFLVSLMMLFVDRGYSVQLKHVLNFLANLDANAPIAPAA
ncbi:unnamed protein product [Cylindrotheca closterium]|uniref:Uncharacterized protein n=1 Tax=Cylindrotheca closterium TaxID=2856 RepID=A0AAD2GAU0_9STRA|nr:unnamed protein product [Cylindrotheca closterium]